MKNKVSSTQVSVKRRSWSWQQYLNEQKAEAAPLSVFTQSQCVPSRRSGFRVGMKLEGVDPLHPSMFCVLTVAEVIGCRLRLHIDGYSECYEFWVNADSANIRQTGWCKDNNHKLHPPKGYSETDFDWQHYLQSTGSHAAPPTLFTCRPASCGFSVGMKLEAVDRKNPGLVCVASVADVIDDHFLVHFDNWDDMYDYWCDSSSPYIHPVGWCEEQGRPLTAPQGHLNPENFLWEEYLLETRTTAAPCSAFTLRAPHGFRGNQKLEAVDRRNPMLVRVATVTDTEDYRVKVHYDGWSEQFDLWSDSDLCDLHPVGWCQRTGHPLEPPPGWPPLSVSQGVCPTPGCRGVGHIKGAKYTGHHSAFGCPYSDINMRKEVVLPDRLGGERVITLVPVSIYHHGNQSDRRSVQVKMEPRDETLLLPLGKRRRQTDRLSQPTKYLRVKQEEEELHIRALGPAESSLQAVLHQSVFLSAMSPQPGRDLSLSLCWEQHGKLLPGVTGVQPETVQHWSVQQVSDFIESLPGCEEQAKQFRDEQIDGRAFLLLTQRDIVRVMSIKLGPALKIYNSILMFKHAEDRNRSHAEDRNRSHAEDRNCSHAGDRNRSHTEDRNRSHTEDRNRSHAEDRNRSHAEDRNRSHAEDSNSSHAEDSNSSHAEDRNRSHAEDRNQSHADDRNCSHAEDRNSSHAEDRNRSHAEDRNRSHAEDRNRSHAEDSNSSHAEDRNRSHAEDSNSSHAEDRNRSHAEDSNSSHAEDRNRSHAEDRNQSHEDRNQSHAENRNHSHAEDRNRSHAEDRNCSHAEDRNCSHAEDRNRSHAEDRNQSHEDRNQSHAENRNQSHAEDSNRSHAEDRSRSHAEDRNRSHAEDKSPSHAEDRNSSNAEDRNRSHAEDRNSSHAEDRSPSHAEDRNSSHAEDKSPSHAEDRNSSNAEDRNRSHAEDRNSSHAEDRSPSHAEDRNRSHAEDRSQSHAEDRNRSHAEDKSPSHAEDRNSSNAEDRNRSHAEDRNSSHAEDRSPSHAEDRNSSNAEDRNRSHAEDRNSSNAEDRNRSHAEDKSPSHAEDRNSSHAEDRSPSHAEDRSPSHAEDRSPSHDEDRNRSHAEDTSVLWEGLHFPSNHQ
ncbi:lethal(3)malignant brain tumor-like protein 4 isoform X2 [Sebastes fasciatus]|uniref:lethal(3)malignant brain tumor-like protein 4 isoform X2 n=1 Tax=Sebastes fasciatus TaxID=394691 RepID=UPI003D9F2422